MNKINEITVNDLIVEYMMVKLENGYNPSYTLSEFINFMKYYNIIYKIDYNKNPVELFNKFYDYKKEFDWHFGTPNLEMNYNNNIKDYIITPTYNLSSYDTGTIATRHLNDYDNKTINSIIKEYLKDKEKRTIKDIEISNDDLLLGKYITANMIFDIWKKYIKDYMEYKEWPKQCTDIYDYLINNDLASIIKLKSIKKDIYNMYNEVPKRIAKMYKTDNKLQINTIDNRFLANSNYRLITEGYEKLFLIAYYCYSDVDINVPKNDFCESHDGNEVVLTNDRTINNEKAKTLVKILDKKR